MIDNFANRQGTGSHAMIAKTARGIMVGLGLAASSSAVSQTVTVPISDTANIRARLAPVMDPPGRPTDAADLDSMLKRGDVASLVKRLRSADTAQGVDLDMNWEQSKLFNGAGFIIAYAYMTDLWKFGSSLPAARGEGLKQTAAMIFLYQVDLIAVDGPQCADITAPGHRRDQLFLQNAPIVGYIRSLPAAARMQIGTISLNLEAATQKVRTKDAVLCSGGLDEISAGLKAQGTKPLPQIPNAPGTFGKTYAVPTAPGYETKFVDEAVWRAKQIAARLALPSTLTHMLTVPAPANAAPPGK